MVINGFQIRKANKNDIDSIINLENNGFEEGLREGREIFIERLDVFNDGFLVLADEDGNVVGYICSEIWDYKDKINEKDFALNHSIIEKHDANAEEIYISSMVLSKDMKGKGWGHILFDYLIDNIKEFYPNLKSSILIVGSRWKEAQKIYFNKGFTKIGVIKDFFQPLNGVNSDAIIMRKLLK